MVTHPGRWRCDKRGQRSAGVAEAELHQLGVSCRGPASQCSSGSRSACGSAAGARPRGTAGHGETGDDSRGGRGARGEALHHSCRGCGSSGNPVKRGSDGKGLADSAPSRYGVRGKEFARMTDRCLSSSRRGISDLPTLSTDMTLRKTRLRLLKPEGGVP